MELPRDRHGLVRRRTVVRRGLTDDHLEWHVKNHDLVRLGGGAYAAVADLPADEWGRRDELYRLRCIGISTAGRAVQNVLSHQSAAAVHGIALLDPDTTRVHTTNSTRAGGAKTVHRFVHPGPLRDADIVEVDGVRVTSLVRTAVDLACAENDFAKALTIFDGALRRGATVDQLTTELKARRRVGAAIARYALAHSDADSASVGESWSRAQMIEADLPTPELQKYYLLPAQDAWVDFDWSGVLTGEFDGEGKYLGGLRADDARADQVVLQEKRRQDQLEALGLKVIRWTWDTLRKGELVGLLRYWLRHFSLLG